MDEMDEMIKDVLQETIANWIAVTIRRANTTDDPSEQKALRLREALMFEEQEAIMTSSTPEWMRKSIYDKIDRLYTKELKEWINQKS